MKLLGQVILFGLIVILFCVFTADAAWQGKTKGMGQKHNDRKEREISTDDNGKHASQSQMATNGIGQVKQKCGQKKADKMPAVKNSSPQNYKDQENKETHSIKSKNQNKEYTKHVDSNYASEESHKEDDFEKYKLREHEKKRKGSRSKGNRKIKETEDDYDSAYVKIKDSKVKDVEKPYENIKTEKGKSCATQKDINEACSEKEMSEGKSKNEKHKLTKKQNKNKPSKKVGKYQKKTKEDDELKDDKFKTTSRRQYKNDDNIQNYNKNQEEKQNNAKTTSKKADTIFGNTADNENIIHGKLPPETICKTHFTIKYEEIYEDLEEPYFEEQSRCSEEHFTENFKYEETNQEKENFIESLKNANDQLTDDKVVDLYLSNIKEMTIEDVDNNGRLSVETKQETIIEITEGPEGVIKENIIENLDTVKLKILRKYELLDLVDNAKDEETNSKKYMYIVEEEFSDCQVRYYAEEDDGKPCCSLPEIEIEDIFC